MGVGLGNDWSTLHYYDLDGADGYEQDEQDHGTTMNINGFSESVSEVNRPHGDLLAAHPCYCHHESMEKALRVSVPQHFSFTYIHEVL